MDFNFKPILTGQLVLLRPMTHDDFEDLYSVASDPLIWQQLPQSDRYKRDVFKSLFDECVTSRGGLVAIKRATNEIIGGSSYYDVNYEKSSVAIGYTFLSRSCWGHTFNKEMKKLMLDHAFSFVDNVIFHIADSNVRSQKAIMKIGAKFVEKVTKQFNGNSALYQTFRVTKADHLR